jgi:hypothetical protein
MIAVVHLWSVIEEECEESWATIGWSLWDEGARLWLPSFCRVLHVTKRRLVSGVG